MTQRKLPIDKLSFSALRSYLASPSAFWRNYVMKQWDNSDTVPMLEGKALHKMLELYYSNLQHEGEAERWFIEESLKIKDWGKTGSLEKSLENISLAAANCLAAMQSGSMPKRENIRILNVESPLMHRIMGHEVPLKATPDLVYSLLSDESEEPALHARDWKKVSSLSATVDEEGNELPVDPKYLLQAYFVACVCEKEYGYPLAEMTFTEVKPTKKADTVGLQNIIVRLGEGWREKPEFIAIAALINDMLEDICYPRKYLPNVTDMFGGKDEWELFLKPFTYDRSTQPQDRANQLD